jgi:hypothetical protein
MKFGIETHVNKATKVFGQKTELLWLFYLYEILTTEVLSLAEARPFVVFLSGEGGGKMGVKSVWLGVGISLLMILVVATSVFSEEEEKEITLEEVKVVASPIIEGNRVDDYGNRVTTVTGKQVEDLNALDFPSALRRTPGVTISRYNIVGSYGGDQGGSIYIRGMGGERPGAEIQTLVDGRPSFVGIWTHPLMDLMSVSNLGHVDVYKGAQPVLYGNSSYGVVNVVTKRMIEEGFTTTIRSAYGSYNTLDEYFEHGGKKEILTIISLGILRRVTGTGRIRMVRFRTILEGWGTDSLMHGMPPSR